jgi:hypothetical protein
MFFGVPIRVFQGRLAWQCGRSLRGQSRSCSASGVGWREVSSSRPRDRAGSAHRCRRSGGPSGRPDVLSATGSRSIARMSWPLSGRCKSTITPASTRASAAWATLSEKVCRPPPGRGSRPPRAVRARAPAFPCRANLALGQHQMHFVRGAIGIRVQSELAVRRLHRSWKAYVRPASRADCGNG